MNKTAILMSALVLSLALSVGCKSHPKEKPSPEPAAPQTAVPQSEINAAKLNNATVPQAVQSAFLREYPKAAIDTIKLRSTSAGQAFYEISYILEGRGGVASYYASGAKAP